MYIPGVNYNRATHGEAQEDITRFGKLAALEGEGAIAAARLQGQVLSNDFNAKSYDLQLNHTLQSTALSQKAFASDQKWAAFSAVGNIAATVFTDIITPLYQQEVKNQESESNRIYDFHMRGLDEKLANEKTRIEAGTGADDTDSEISNTDRLHEAYEDSHREAMTEAGKAIRDPQLREAQTNKWADNSVLARANLAETARAWDTEFVANKWQSEFDILGLSPSPLNFAKQEAMLHDAKSNKIIGATKYATDLAVLRNTREVEYVNQSIFEVEGSTGDEQAALMQGLEQQIADSKQLQTLGGTAERQAYGALEKIRVETAKQLKATRKALITTVEKDTQIILRAQRDLIASTTGDGVSANQIMAARMAAANSWQLIDINLANNPAAQDAAVVKLNKSLTSAYVQAMDGVLNRQPGPDVGAFTILRETVIGSTPMELGFMDATTGPDAKKGLLSDIDALAKEHKTALTTQAEQRIKTEAFASFDNKTWTPPLGDEYKYDTMGFHGTVSDTDVKESVYTQSMSLINDMRKNEGPMPPGGWYFEHDERAIGQYGDDIPSIMVDDIKGSLIASDHNTFVEAADRLSDLRLMTTYAGGQEGGKVAAVKIRDSLTEQHRARLDFYEYANRDGILTSDEMIMIGEVAAYNQNVTKQQRNEDAANVAAKYGKPEQQMNLLEEVIKREGYPKDMIKMFEDNPYLLQKLDRRIDEYAGAVHPAVAGYRAAATTLSTIGLTEREGLILTGEPTMETFMNAGLPMVGLGKAMGTWRADTGIEQVYEDSGPWLESVGHRLDAAGQPMLDVNNEPLFEATYMNVAGEYLADPADPSGRTPAVFQPDKNTFASVIKMEKKIQASDNKTAYLSGQAAIAEIYKRYPNMENDWWNRNTWGDDVGTPFGVDWTQAGITDPTEIENLEKQMAEARAASSSSALPSAWWTSFDPDQAKARDLSSKEENLIKEQVYIKFDQWIEDVGHDVGSVGYQEIHGMAEAAYKAALWNAKHNDRAWPGFDLEGFQNSYNPPPELDDTNSFLFPNTAWPVH